MDKLKEKLTLAWDMAARHDEEAKAKSKSYFDRRATTRTFEVGDMVMTLEPSPTDHSGMARTRLLKRLLSSFHAGSTQEGETFPGQWTEGLAELARNSRCGIL